MNMRILFFQTPSRNAHLPAPLFDGSAIALGAHITDCVEAESCTILRVRVTFPFCFLESVSLLILTSHPHLTGGDLGPLRVTQHSEVLPQLFLVLCHEAPAFPNRTAQPFWKAGLAVQAAYCSQDTGNYSFHLKVTGLKLTWNEPRASSKNSWISMASSGEKAKMI